MVNVSQIALCGRSDYATERFFDGKIAHFTLYDQAIDNNTVGPCMASTGRSQAPSACASLCDGQSSLHLHCLALSSTSARALPRSYTAPVAQPPLAHLQAMLRRSA